MSTTTLVTYTLVAALVGTETELGPNRRWEPINEEQKRFVVQAFTPHRIEVGSIPEIESISSRKHTVVNDFLAARGFTIKLDEFPNPDDFGVASVLKLAIEWQVKGVATTLRLHESENTFPAVRMEDKGVQFFTTPSHPHPVVKLLTKSGDEVYLIMVDAALREDQLGGAAKRILEGLRPHPDTFASLTFPMVDLNEKPDIRWLKGLHTKGIDKRPAIVGQALQQTKFAMDEVGARVESAVAIAMTRSIGGPRRYVIDRPFLAVVQRPSLKLPIFVGYIDTDSWKKPQR